MANHVFQQVICSKDFFEIYFLDNYPIEARYEFEEALADSAHIVWYYLLENKINWLDRATLLDLPRYYEE